MIMNQKSMKKSYRVLFINRYKKSYNILDEEKDLFSPCNKRICFTDIITNNFIMIGFKGYRFYRSWKISCEDTVHIMIL